MPTPTVTATAAPSAPLADRFARLGAQIIDGLIMAPAAFIYAATAAKTMLELTPETAASLTEAQMQQLAAQSSMPTLIFVAYIIIVTVAQVVMLSKHGQTIGKKVLKMKIVKVDTGMNGGFVTNVVLRGFVNGLLGIIPFYSLIDILFIFSDDRRCLHDKIAGTKVVMA